MHGDIFIVIPLLCLSKHLQSMTDSILKMQEHAYASAVDPNVAAYTMSKDFSMDDLREFSGTLIK